MRGWLSRLLGPLFPSPPAIEPGEDVLFVDVRTGREYASGHVAGAVHIPFNQMADRWRELEAHRDRRMLLYCHSGPRAGAATRVLRAHGFERAENAGGIRGLRKAGLAIEKGA